MSVPGETVDTFPVTITGATCAVQTENFDIRQGVSAAGNIAPTLLYSSASAEIAFAAAWTYTPAVQGETATPASLIGSWSGTGAGDMVVGTFL